MHEYSLVSALLQKVEGTARAHGATAVHRLEVEIGELAGVEIELFETAYETFRERSVCAGAPLEILRVPARWECPACREEIPRGETLRCPACGRPARLASGDEIRLRTVELEVA